MRAVAIAALCAGPGESQTVMCPGGVVAPDFGWRATDCGQCVVHASYLEYLTPPRVRDISAHGPAASKLRENDMLLAVNALDITTPDAWHAMRYAEAGTAVRFTVLRGGDTITVAVVPGARCAPAEPNRAAGTAVIVIRRPPT